MIFKFLSSISHPN